MLLTADQVQQALTTLPGWTGDTEHLVLEHQFATFPDAILGVAAVAAAAERLDHHPDIDIRWRTVTFRLSTHTAGGVTEKDTDAAAVFDLVLGRTSAP